MLFPKKKQEEFIEYNKIDCFHLNLLIFSIRLHNKYKSYIYK